MKGKKLEFFHPGLPNGLKAIVDEVGKRLELIFYTSARLDGLKRRVEVMGEKMVEEYDETSEHNLSYRSVAVDERVSTVGQLYTVNSRLGEMVIVKMCEKFRIDARSTEEQVSRVTYHILPKGESRASVQFHYKSGRITYSDREYRKDG